MLRKVKRIKLGKQIYRRLMRRVLERDGWRCQEWGSLENFQVHHKIKRSQRGNDCLENLVTPVCLLPHGIAWAAELPHASGQSVQEKPKPRTKCHSPQSSQGRLSRSVGGGQIGPDLPGSEGAISTK
jgi:hypothetical protein